MKFFFLFAVLFQLSSANRVNEIHRSHSTTSVKKQSLITGGCGFVGRRFTKHLCDMGYSITVVDNMISESALSLPDWPEALKPHESCEIEFYEMDCRDFFLSPLSNKHYDLFLHLAAVVGGRAKIEGAPVAVADDLAIDATAFQWAIDSTHKQMPTNMIYFSSSAAYPVKYQTVNSKVQLDEKMIDLEGDSADIAKPDLTYGWAKLTGEYLAKLSAQHYHLNVSVYRPMSGYGEDQHEAYPFKSILLKAAQKLNPIEIWSDAVRDFVHIEDIVTCVLSSYERIANKADPVNLATGVATSFSELAKMIAKEMGYSAEVKVLNGMPQGVMYRVGNPKHEQELGCKITITLTDGIRRSIAFLQETEKRQAQAAAATAKNKPPTSEKDDKPTSMDDDESKEHIHPAARSNRHPHIPKDHPVFSSFSCIGASQFVSEHYWARPKVLWKFPLNDPKFRACRFHNVCWRKSDQKMIFYQDPFWNNEAVLSPFRIKDWQGQQGGKGIVAGGVLAPAPLAFEVESSPTGIPKHFTFDRSAALHYFDINSWSYNYGHYLYDDVLPQFVITDLFGSSPYDSHRFPKRQVLPHSCRWFGGPSDRAQQIVDYNHSLGTYREASLDRFNSMWKYFFEAPPLYLEPIYSDDVCFETIFIGQTSMYSLANIETSRAGHVRKFRDFVLRRLEASGHVMPPQEKRILVGLRSAGHTTDFLPNLCQKVQHQVHHERHYQDLKEYEVTCIVNQDLSFVEEIQMVQSSKILISSHGTISHMSMFAREGTQQIVLYDPKENRYKEHNVLMYVSHVHVMFHSAADVDRLGPLLRYAVNAMGIFEREELPYLTTDSSIGKGKGLDYRQFEHLTEGMIPKEGRYIRSATTNPVSPEIFQMRGGKRVALTAEEKKRLNMSAVEVMDNWELEKLPLGGR